MNGNVENLAEKIQTLSPEQMAEVEDSSIFCVSVRRIAASFARVRN